MMNSYGNIEQIASLVSQRKGPFPLLVAIDGHSAAGKSTVARNLASSIENTAVITTDDFYRPMSAARRFGLKAPEGYAHYYDWQRLRVEALEPLSVAKAAKFRIYDWQNNRLGQWKTIQPHEVIIVEGCYSARPELSAFYSVIVLVETSAKARGQRQIKRDDATEAWLSRWDAAEAFYLATTDLRGRADIVVAGHNGNQR